MAIIREYVTSNGVTVRIADDCCAGISEEEKLRRRQALRRVLDRIAANAAAAPCGLTEPTDEKGATDDTDHTEG